MFKTLSHFNFSFEYDIHSKLSISVMGSKSNPRFQGFLITNARCISLKCALHLGKQHVAFSQMQRANSKMQRAFGRNATCLFGWVQPGKRL